MTLSISGSMVSKTHLLLLASYQFTVFIVSVFCVAGIV